jgi:hypothetical protein
MRRIPFRAAGVVLLLLMLLLRSSPSRAIDHGAFTVLLGKYVRDGQVDYGGLLKDRAALDAYLGTLRAVTKADYASWSESDRLAYWLNLYNAETLALMLDFPGASSIRKLGWFGWASNPWKKERIPLKALRGGVISLDEVEQNIIRKEFREPRIHFALVCASRSCPKLRAEAYEGARLNAQLDDQARDFLHDPFKNRWNAAHRTLSLSKIFDWYKADFEAAGGVVPFVARYLPGDEGKSVLAGPVTVEFLDYDWSLNGRW